MATNPPPDTPDEQDFYRAMHYMAGAAVVLDVKGEAMRVLSEVVQGAMKSGGAVGNRAADRSTRTPGKQNAPRQ